MDPYIKTYDPADAASIAQMWNESDEGWPGGFSAGVPFTEERVRQWLSDERYIDVFLVMADNRVVAYCSLYEYAAEPSAAYVNLLNCHPKYWKNGFGRDLLRKAVARSAELGYRRLDLHTWPGNMRAVPLYKKTGFFWQPETLVHMLNFLPLILPLARDFLGDADWYTAFRRELKQEEDDITWNGMKVYPYHFEIDGRVLKATVDRESRGLTAFENDDFSISCSLPAEDLLAGVSAPIRWEIVNKRAEPLAVSLLASAESGLSVTKQASLSVSDRAVIEGEVVIDRDIAARDKDEPAHKITSTLVIGGRLMALETGARPKQAVDIAAEPVYISLTPGHDTTVHLRLKNNLNQPATARVALIAPPGVAITPAQHNVEMPADGYGGATCSLRAGSAGAPNVLAALTVERAQGPISVKPVALPVAVAGPGRPAAYLRPEEAVLENEWLRLVVAYRGAQITVYRKPGNAVVLSQRAVIGPPYYPNEFRGMRFSARIAEHAGVATVTLSAPSRQYPGVVFERVFTIDSSPVAHITHHLHNTGNAERRFQIGLSHFSQFGETSMALPTRAGVVVDQMPSFPDWYDADGVKPENLSESWLAFNGQGFAAGVIWQNATEHEMDAWTRPSLKLAMPPLPPFGQTEAPPFYIYVGPGDWRDVRAVWQRCVNPQAPAAAPAPRRLLHVSTATSPVVLLGSTTQTTLSLDNQRSRAIAGVAEISTPAGWTVSPERHEFKNLKRGQPVDLPLVVRRRRARGPEAALGVVTVRHELAEEEAPLPLIALGRHGGVSLSESDQEGQRVVSIDNGWLRLRVAPHFVGSLVALEHEGINHLFSSFPTPRAFSWVNPWHGGVSPVLHAHGDDEAGPGNPGRMWQETWGYELLRPRRGASAPWTGVRVYSNLRRDCFRGLRLETDYLTVGQSNVVAVVTRLVNPTSAPFGGTLITGAHTQPGGERDRVMLYDLGSRRIPRVRDLIWGASSGRWACVAHTGNGWRLVMVGGRNTGQVIALDFGLDGAHLYGLSIPALSPNSTFETTSYLVLTRSDEQARLYRWLENWTWPEK